MATTYRQLLNYATSELKGNNHALWLLQAVLETDRTELYLKLDESVDEVVLRDLTEKIAEVKSGLPIQYAVGTWQFRSITLKVDRRCLIPRVETEHLVTLANNIIDKLDKLELNILDLGTGSLCIPLALASESVKKLNIYAVDISDDAIEIAEENLKANPRLHDAISIVKSRWFDCLNKDLIGSFDLIISNPPYLNNNSIVDKSVIDFEPHIALFSEEAGFSDTKLIISEAKAWMSEKSYLLLETDPSLTDRILFECGRNGFQNCEIIKDQFDRFRFVMAES